MNNTALSVSAQVSVIEPDQIVEQFKSSTDDRPIVIGCLRITVTKISTGTDVKFDFAIRMNRDVLIDWYPVISIPEPMYDQIASGKLNISDKTKFINIINEAIEFRDEFLIFWFGIQLALLNPVIKERVHKTTMPIPEKLNKQTKKKNAKKSPKKYVKRITIDDISDIEIGATKNPHSITEPFWWVSGHMRNQKVKGGHKMTFIQGYWKGPLKEQAEKIYGEPRQRELVLEDEDSEED